MLQDLLLLVLAMVIARALWRVIDGAREGPAGGAPARHGHVPTQGVQMVRDPVCGTYVIPDRAVALTDGSRRVFFCSADCRDQYFARRSSSGARSASRDEPAEGRTA